MPLSSASVVVVFTAYVCIIMFLLVSQTDLVNGSATSDHFDKCPFPYVTNVEGSESCTKKCELGTVPSYDRTHCVGCLPHLYAFNGSCVKECPRGYWYREAVRDYFTHVYKGDEMFYGKRCEPERIGVVESWGDP